MSRSAASSRENFLHSLTSATERPISEAEMKRFIPQALAAAVLLSLVCACDPAAIILAGKIFHAPNKVYRNGLEFSPQVQAMAASAYAQTFDLAAPNASLRVAIVEPGDYVFQWAPHVEGRNVWMDRPMMLSMTRSPGPARGLIVALHGFGSCKEQMTPWAFDLASHGYRVALVDLRGHGASSGEWVSFGPLEKRDLKIVVDELERRGLTENNLGLLGVSYGASIALDFAAADHRVRTVVAMEPFSSAQQGIPELARAAFPEHAANISDRLFASAFSIAARRGMFDWAETDTGRSIPSIACPLFFIHGAADTWLSPEHSKRLLRDAKPGSRLLLVADETHVSLPLGVQKVSGEVRAWFDAQLAPATVIASTL